MALLSRLVAGFEQAATTELVVAEVIWFLRTRRSGRLTGDRIREMLLPVLSARSLHLPDKRLWLRILDLLVEHNLDVPDLHLIAQLQRDTDVRVLLGDEGEAELYSYDRGFDHIAGVTRLVP